MKIRTTCPKNNKYYIRKVTGGLNGAVAGNPTQRYANVLDNCVGYANGRFNESINDPDLKGIVKAFKYQLVCDAEDFIESAKRQGLKISSTPIEGGIMVWQKGRTLSPSDGAGHVAFVERVYDDGSIMTSESGWASWAFKTVRRDNKNGRWGQNSNYKFRGCIINPSIKDPKVVSVPPLTVDGIGGACTVRAMQRFFGTPQDGVISGQNRAQSKFYPSLTAVEFGKGGSVCIKKLQKWCGASADGVLGENTVKAWQKKLKAEGYYNGGIDGVFGKGSMKAWQTFLNDKLFKTETTPQAPEGKPSTPSTDEGNAPYKVIDVSDWQDKIDWNKVKADGVVGAIIRYADGTTLDKRFQENMVNAKAAGLHIGSYIFSRAKTKAQAEAEAERLFNACKPYNLDMPMYIDLEVSGLSKYADTVAPAFLNKMASLGGNGGVYANLNWWNHYLTKTARDYSNNAFWIAQYNSTMDYKPASRMGMWQYTSSGKVNGINGKVDMDWCYVAYWKKPTEPTVPTEPPKKEEPKGYDGEMPTLSLKKTNAEVIEDTIRWLKWIANDNSFHYGHGEHAHHNGCYFCNTEAKFKEGHGIVDWEKTYCCNPFISAGWAHGGCVTEALKMCQKCDSYDFHRGNGYDKSKLFDNLGKIDKKDLKRGDVLCRGNGSSGSGHVMLYLGDGKVVHAHGGDDNIKGSDSWKNSINIESLGNKKYQRVHRFNSTVNTTQAIYFGEVSKRVEQLQHFLIWYGYAVSADGIYGEQTHGVIKDFQKKNGLVEDGIVGSATLSKMLEAEK